jgi:DNA mismatch repair ATPase MutL
VSANTDPKEVSVKVTSKIAAITLTALALAGVGASTALASTQATSKTPAAVNRSQPTTTSPGSDGEQQDDQASPTSQNQDMQDKADKADKADSTTQPNDKKSAGKDQSESKDVADGPGGHVDQAGDVNHKAAGQD